MSKKLNVFIDTVSNLTRLPGLYLINRVEDIEKIFQGYEFAIVNFSLDKEYLDFIRGFKLFVNKWAESEFETNWAKLIRFHSSTDISSIDLFNKLFFEYIDQLNITNDSPSSS